MSEKTHFTLTKTQRSYLDAMSTHYPLRQGWGGHASTRTVRILEERGLCQVRTWPTVGGADYWEAYITSSGREAIGV